MNLAVKSGMLFHPANIVLPYPTGPISVAIAVRLRKKPIGMHRVGVGGCCRETTPGAFASIR